MPSLRLTEDEGQGRGETDKQGHEGPQSKLPKKLLGFPRTTVLPGLQFILAGIIGKPDQFFLVPFVRFFFDTSSYL